MHDLWVEEGRAGMSSPLAVRFSRAMMPIAVSSAAVMGRMVMSVLMVASRTVFVQQSYTTCQQEPVDKRRCEASPLAEAVSVARS